MHSNLLHSRLLDRRSPRRPLFATYVEYLVLTTGRASPLVEPHRIPETSRRLGAVFSFIFFLCGLVVEGAKLPHPESMSFGGFGVWFLRAAVIGFMVMAAASGMVVVAGKVRKWVVGG